jgi:hypothetical protein
VPSRLQKWQKNQIFEAIQAVGLDPREFHLENDDAEVSIKHKWSASHFTIVGDLGHYGGRYVVGDAPAWPFEANTWQYFVTRMTHWLEEVKRDLAMPDLWADLQRDSQLLFGAGADDGAENRPFTQAEQKEIAAQLQALAEHARRTYSLSPPQIRALEAKVDYLVNAARRLGRIDWRNVCAGASLGYILSTSLPPEAARGMLSALIRAIGHLYGLPDLPMLPC